MILLGSIIQIARKTLLCCEKFPMVRDGSAGCETVLPSGAANCKLRNRPPVGSGKLQAAKPSSRWERQIAGCETVLPLGAANCRLRKSPPIRSGKLQQSTVGAYRIRPNTYAMTSGRIQGVCDTPLHRFLLNNH